MPGRLGAIDIGSNTIHLLVARTRPGEIPVPVFRRRSFVQLGADVASFGAIGPERLAAAVATLGEQVAAARAAGVTALAIGATQALRAASNGAEVAGALSRAAEGRPIRVLTPHQEAALAFTGATLGLAPRDSVLLLDIGGASTQLASGRTGRMETVDSLPLGSGTVAARAQADPPTPEEWVAMERRVSERLPQLRPVGQGLTVLGTGGTITNLPRFEGPPVPAVLRPETLERILEHFRRETLVQLQARSGVDLERIRLCRGGILILAQLLDLLHLDRVRRSERGLRDGMIAGLRERGADWWDVGPRTVAARRPGEPATAHP